jgi:hypothetical protein
VPDLSTFSKNRHGRFRESDLLRELFETTVQRCMAEGLVGGEGFAADASLIKADANKQRSVEGSEEVDWEAMASTAARSGSISTRWTRLPGALPARSGRSSFRNLIRPRNGPARSRAMPSSPTPPTT